MITNPLTRPKTFIMLKLIYDKKPGYSKSYSGTYAKTEYYYMVKIFYYKVYCNLNLPILGIFRSRKI